MTAVTTNWVFPSSNDYVIRHLGHKNHVALHKDSLNRLGCHYISNIVDLKITNLQNKHYFVIWSTPFPVKGLSNNAHTMLDFWRIVVYPAYSHRDESLTILVLTWSG